MTTSDHEDGVLAEIRAGAQRALATRNAAQIEAEPKQHSGGLGRKALSQVSWMTAIGGSRDVWHLTGGIGGVFAVIGTILAGVIVAVKLWPSAVPSP